MKFITIIGTLFMTTFLGGQDLVFSNMNLAAFEMAPSISTISNEKTIVGVNYRQSLIFSRSAGNYRYYAAYLSGFHDLSDDDRLAYGMEIDQLGSSGAYLKRIHPKVNLAYMKKLWKVGDFTHYLSVGTNLGWAHYRSYENDYWFGTQYNIDEQRVDLGIPSGESIIRGDRSTGRPDISLGLTWLTTKGESLTYAIGAALHHLGPASNVRRPASIDLHVQRRWSIFSSLNYRVNKKIGLASTVLSNIQEPFVSIYWRSFITLMADQMNSDELFGIGIGPRFANHFGSFGPESINLEFFLSINRMNLGLSYNIILSELSTFTNSRGGFELNLAYRLSPIASDIKHRF